MSESIHPIIRSLLKNTDGLTIAELHKLTGRSGDAYIDRWGEKVRGQYPAIWCDQYKQIATDAVAAQPAPVQEPDSECNPYDLCAGCRCKFSAAQSAPVQEPVKPLCKVGGMPAPGRMCQFIITGGKLCGHKHDCPHKDTTPPAQPAVPDAFGTREGEHPQYIQGWNDCRAEMLKGMKP